MRELPEEVSAAFSPLLGTPCWNVRVGHGSFLTLEFGEPHLEIHAPRPPNPSHTPRMQKLFARRRVYVHGEWHLWIYCCDWRVTAHGEPVGDSDSDEDMERAARELDGQALVEVEHDPASGGWSFVFDLGGRLETWPYELLHGSIDPAEEQWHLYEPSGLVLTLFGDGSFTRHPGDTPEPLQAERIRPETERRSP